MHSATIRSPRFREASVTGAGFKDKPRITCNARMGSRELKQYCALDESTLELLKFAMGDLT
jgi:hypothetical protein